MGLSVQPQLALWGALKDPIKFRGGVDFALADDAFVSIDIRNKDQGKKVEVKGFHKNIHGHKPEFDMPNCRRPASSDSRARNGKCKADL